MRKFGVIVALFLLANTGVFCQNVDRKFTLQTSPFLFLYDIIYLGGFDAFSGTFFGMDMEAQYKINELFNLSLIVFFSTDSHTITHTTYTDFPTYYSSTESYEEKTFYMNFRPIFIIRPLQTGLRGFYIGVYPIIGWQSLKAADENHVFADIGFGLSSGYKWIFKNGFTLQLGGGIGKSWKIPEKPDGSFAPDGRLPLKNFDVILDFKLGYSF